MLRPLTLADAATGLTLTQAQNWSHQAHDWSLALRLGHGIGELDEDGTLVGTALRWDYGPAFATIGLVVVRPDRQGRGIGRRLMQALIDGAGARTLCLIATPAGIKLYRDLGFVDVGVIEQWQGTVIRLPPPATNHWRIRSLDAADLSAVVSMDRRALGGDREALIHAVWHESQRGFVAERAGQLCGFALLRPAGRGTTVGPVIAETESIASTLAAHALSTIDGIGRLDIPTEAQTLKGALAAAGLSCVDRVTLMRRGAPLPTDSTCARYAIVSQAYC